MPGSLSSNGFCSVNSSSVGELLKLEVRLMLFSNPCPPFGEDLLTGVGTATSLSTFSLSSDWLGCTSRASLVSMDAICWSCFQDESEWGEEEGFGLSCCSSVDLEEKEGGWGMSVVSLVSVQWY